MATEDIQALPGAGPVGGEEPPLLDRPAASRELALRLAASGFPRTCTCATLRDALSEEGLLTRSGILFAPSSLMEGRCSPWKRGASLKRNTWNFAPRQPGTTSREHSVSSLTSLAITSAQGPGIPETLRRRTTGRHFRCLLLSRGPVGGRDGSVGLVLSPLPGGRDVGA